MGWAMAAQNKTLASWRLGVSPCSLSPKTVRRLGGGAVDRTNVERRTSGLTGAARTSVRMKAHPARRVQCRPMVGHFQLVLPSSVDLGAAAGLGLPHDDPLVINADLPSGQEAAAACETPTRLVRGSRCRNCRFHDPQRRRESVAPFRPSRGLPPR